MSTTAKLYSFNLANTKTYLFAAIFIVGNLLLPQLAHLVPQGGLIFLPIYFFTLIAAYKYGIHVGLLTAVLSPLANHLLFGMPPAAVLPAILIKSVILAIAAAIAAKHAGKVSLVAILLAILAYQLIGTGIEWAITQNFAIAIQDFRLGVPGMLVQLFGGYLVLKALSKI
ncbi:ECF transporter S component [Proteiniphilum sp.]|uniref:ECF transporter S component n=1 Tax=Proteiniphilum sp. TaxID=1926877 RepID=UPI00332D01BD